MFWNTSIRFFLEGYIDFALVSFVQMYDLRLVKSQVDNLDGKWFYFGDWISSIIAILMLVAVIASPFVFRRFIKGNEENFL